MRFAMTLLAIGAAGIGLIQIPNVDYVVDDFLKPSFATSALYEVHTRNGLLIAGLIGGTLIGLAGIGIAWRIWGAGTQTAPAFQERLRPLYTLFAAKWYFDEAIDMLVVRPAAAFGAFAKGTFEPTVIDDALIGGPSGLVRAGSALVRSVQSGLIRYYAAMIVLGVAAVGLYFLLQA
jgi:NADH-quinone oxidoreductase subunit L